MQIALAWLLHRAPNILLIPGTSRSSISGRISMLRALQLSPETIAKLDSIAAASRGGLITTSVIGDFCCFNVKMTFQHEYAILGLNGRP